MLVCLNVIYHLLSTVIDHKHQEMFFPIIQIAVIEFIPPFASFTPHLFTRQVHAELTGEKLAIEQGIGHPETLGHDLLALQW